MSNNDSQTQRAPMDLAELIRANLAEKAAIMNEPSVNEEIDPEIESMLSLRATHVLMNAGFAVNKDSIESLLKKARSRRIRNLGPATLNEFRRAIGMEEVSPRSNPWKFNPWTGEPIIKRGNGNKPPKAQS